MTRMQTPLRKVRGLGSAKEGTDHFWRIRVSSVALIPLSLFAVGLVLSLAGASFEETRAVLAQPFVTLLLALFILVSLDHMRLGMQVIIEDYVHDEGLKVASLMLNLFFVVVIGALSLFALLKIAFGG